MAKITKRTVDAAEPREARYYVWDDQIKGFGLLVLPTTVKSYIFRYRNQTGTERRATLGKHGTLTPDEARTKADDMRRAVAAGRDPLDEKQERRKAATVGEILDAYLTSESFKTKSDQTRLTDKGRINRHLKPLLGKQKVEALTPDKIEKARADIAQGKTAVREKMGKRALARVRGGEGAARKSIRLLKSSLNWAVRERLIPANPIDDIATGPDGEKELILDDAGAYGRMFVAIDTLEREKKISASAADAIRVVALTGARRGEIAGMRWRHVDLTKGLITLPYRSHKTGKKIGKPRVIGLPEAAQAIVNRQDAREPDDFVFVPAHGEGPVNLSKPWEKIRKGAKLPAGLGLHGLRHSLASHMAMAGSQASEIMTTLGHRNLSTSQRYIHWAQSKQQSIAEKAAAVALAGMKANSASEPGDGEEQNK